MPGWLTWLVIVLWLIAESILLWMFNLGDIAFQIAIIATVYLGLRRDFIGGAWVLLGLMFPIEWLVSGYSGYYSLGLVVVYSMMRIIQKPLANSWRMSHLVTVIAMCWVHGLFMMLLQMIFAVDIALWRHIPGALIISTPAVALIAWPIGKLLERLDKLFSHRPKGHYLSGTMTIH